MTTIAHVGRREFLAGLAAAGATALVPDVDGALREIEYAFGRRVELIGQVFNLLNRTNLLAAWQANALSNAFGTSVSAANMRQAEVAVRFSF